jgi:hypothetical protein
MDSPKFDWIAAAEEAAARVRSKQAADGPDGFIPLWKLKEEAHWEVLRETRVRRWEESEEDYDRGMQEFEDTLDHLIDR